jgi:hypothetical protein
MTRTTYLLAAMFALALPSMACSSMEEDDLSCEDGTCDTPGDAADRACRDQCGGKGGTCFDTCRMEKAVGHCKLRQKDAISSSQKAFTKDAIRWACSDVEGVTTQFKDDRGQEYCEYYAIVAPPPAEAGKDAPAPVALGRTARSTTSRLDLSEDQEIALEDEPNAVVGECVFHSWHQDIEDPLPVCKSAASCAELTAPATATLGSWMKGPGLGFKMTEDMLRMKISINSNSAASDLADKCMSEASRAKTFGTAETAADDYLRGCMTSFKLFTTEWRRSDPTICAATLRAAECGCGIDTNGDNKADITSPSDIAFGLVPPGGGRDKAGKLMLRGFPLGTWSNAKGLPAGCRYAETGDDSRTVVTCDLLASDVLSGRGDVKDKCREKYGNDVVVHIPVPVAKAANTPRLVCNPPAGGEFSKTCGEMAPFTAKTTK